MVHVYAHTKILVTELTLEPIPAPSVEQFPVHLIVSSAHYLARVQMCVQKIV